MVRCNMLHLQCKNTHFHRRITYGCTPQSDQGQPPARLYGRHYFCTKHDFSQAWATRCSQGIVSQTCPKALLRAFQKVRASLQCCQGSTSAAKLASSLKECDQLRCHDGIVSCRKLRSFHVQWRYSMRRSCKATGRSGRRLSAMRGTQKLYAKPTIRRSTKAVASLLSNGC